METMGSGLSGCGRAFGPVGEGGCRAGVSMYGVAVGVECSVLEDSCVEVEMDGSAGLTGEWGS